MFFFKVASISCDYEMNAFKSPTNVSILMLSHRKLSNTGSRLEQSGKSRVVARLRQAVTDQHHLVDIWALGEEEFEETKDVIGGLAYPAHKYGLVLYENT
jgi:hypothetical protein